MNSTIGVGMPATVAGDGGKPDPSAEQETAASADQQDRRTAKHLAHLRGNLARRPETERRGPSFPASEWQDRLPDAAVNGGDRRTR